MDNLDFGALGIVMLLVQIVLPSIPAIIIGTVGVLAARKGYSMSGIAIAASAAVSLASIVGNTLILRSMDLAAYSNLYVYIFQGLYIISSGLLCGGLIGLIITVPKAADSASDR